jgi:hypothetical protein
MKKLLFVCCIALIETQAHYSQIGDLHSRIGLEAGFKLNNKISCDLAVQSRSNWSERRYSSTNFSLQINYQFLKNWKVGVSYRNSMQPNPFAYLDGNDLSFRNRYQFALRYNPSKLLHLDKFLDFELRSIIQYEQFQYKRNQWYSRNRLSVEPKLKVNWIQPYASFELLYRFNQYSYFIDDLLVTQGLMNEFRYIGGIKFNVNKKNTIDAALMFRDYRTQKASNPILSITYSHNFGKIFKSK